MDINSVLEEMKKCGVTPDNINLEIAQLEEELSLLSNIIDRGGIDETPGGL